MNSSLSVPCCSIAIKCHDPRVLRTLQAKLRRDGVSQPRSSGPGIFNRHKGRPTQIYITRSGCGPLMAEDYAELLYAAEKDLTIELQKQRSDLYFLHAAALALSDNAFLLVAPSGSDKSTTIWELMHHGFSYLSDELSPVDLTTMEVHGYPHAICFKKNPCRVPASREHDSDSTDTARSGPAIAGLSRAAPIEVRFLFECLSRGEIPRATSRQQGRNGGSPDCSSPQSAGPCRSWARGSRHDG